jgi:hypothetical protein
MLFGFDSIYIHFDLEWMDVDKMVQSIFQIIFNFKIY